MSYVRVLCLRREAEAPTTVKTRNVSEEVIVVAPSDIPVKKVPEELDQAAKKLEQEIDNFEEAVLGPTTVRSVGVLTGEKKKSDNGTIIHTISSDEYIVHK
jgi:predicted metal-dependent hydrolase